MDQGSATSSALQQLQSNNEQTRNTAMAGRMANVFSDLLAGYNQGQSNAGAALAKQQYANPLGNFFNNDQPVSGKVTR
jgi:hypothetical protein